MFYIEELRKATSETAAMLARDEDRVSSPEYTAEVRGRYGEDTDVYACQLGFLQGTVEKAKRGMSLISRLAEHAQEESAWPERCAALCEALGIDSDNIEALELMTKDTRYRSECGDLTERIREAAGEIISDTREREHDDAVKALETAGFVAVERDDFEGWERTYTLPAPAPTPSMITTPTPVIEHATIEMKHRRGEFWGGEFWYKFTLEVNGVESLRGKSGEFQKLLEAVGIKQEVGN